MKETEVTEHWKKAFDYDWVGTYVLPDGKPISVVIKSVMKAEDAKVMGRSKNILLAHFEPNPYFKVPMIINKENSKRLTRLTLKARPCDWKNIPVVLCQEMDKMPDGTKDFAMRIDVEASKKIQTASKVKITLGVTDGNYASIKSWLSEDGHTLASVISKYELSKEALDDLKTVKGE